MADTDFSQWNPGAVNIENDSTYQADSQRSGGAVSGVFAANLANKVFYQLSTFVRAFALMMVNKGYSPKDGTSPYVADASANTAVTALAAVLANVITASDRVQIVNSVPVTITNPGTTVVGTTATIAAGAVKAGQVLRLRGGVRCTSAPSSPTTVTLRYGAIPLGVFSIVNSGDFAKFDVELNSESGLIWTYASGLGLSAGVQASVSSNGSFSGALTGASSVNLAVAGIGTGTFVTDYVTAETIG